jgi:hypothetical protein
VTALPATCCELARDLADRPDQPDPVDAGERDEPEEICPRCGATPRTRWCPYLCEQRAVLPGGTSVTAATPGPAVEHRCGERR